MAKRAKRASRPNPRQDRNKPYAGKTSNIIEFDREKKTGPRNRSNSERKATPNIVPRTLKQEELLEALVNPKTYITFAIGPAGTGKTLLATHHAIQSLKNGTIEKIVITRPNVAVDDADIGFLPGDLIAKMTPWMLPILDVFYEYYSKQEVTAMIEDDVVSIVSMGLLRGRTFKKAIVLIDEAQNTSPSLLLSALTRIGEGSRMVITGDLKQSDRGSNNGLSDFVKRFSEQSTDMIKLVEFEQKDVQRHPVIKLVLDMYKDVQ